jgi:pimeloyl-ACP methyl ester carboxylesterase
MAVIPVRSASGEATITVNESGTGRPILLLHGGAGPISMARFAETLSQGGRLRALTPIVPGFQGTPRPEWLTTVRGLGEVFSSLLDALELRDVVVLGNSVGGWIAAELALQQNPRMSRLVLVDAGGLEVEGHPAANVFSLSPDQLAQLSFRQPEKFRIDPSKLTDQQKAGVAANRATLRLYGGATGADPDLPRRLASLGVPTLVVWGAADRIFPREHGEAYARAIPGARLQIIEEAGHLPPMETPEILARLVTQFVAAG